MNTTKSPWLTTNREGNSLLKARNKAKVEIENRLAVLTRLMLFAEATALS